VRGARPAAGAGAHEPRGADGRRQASVSICARDYGSLSLRGLRRNRAIASAKRYP